MREKKNLKKECCIIYDIITINVLGMLETFHAT